MVGSVWLRVLVAGVAVLGLAGCSKADRAVIGAPGCPDGGSAGRPDPARPQTGAVWAYGPHSGLPDGARAGGAVPGWSDVVSVADSGYTTVAVKADGTVWAYGTNIKGSLGQGAHERVYEGEPRRVAGISDARSVHVGGETFFVVRRDGTVTAWGSQNILVNAGKREGHQGVPTPRTVPGAEDVVSMGPGSLTTFALRSDGRVLGWGINLTDVLGDEDGTGLTEVDGVEGVVDVASAGGAVVAVRGDGRVCAWGNNAHGLLGVEPHGGQTGRPVLVPGLENIVRVAGGEDLAFALDEDGAVWAWGRGASGVLGDGDTSEHSSAKPVRVRGLPAVRSIAAFQYTGLAVDTDGGLWGWGSGLVLGDHGKGRADGTPVRITVPGPVLEVSGRHVIVEAASEETGDGAGAAGRG
ncbi:RCC1 domain-containing protein [Streptomyces sp. NPDC127091]|uniref:RCC1 repeat domain-containing protein n=1 Tax=Streptomyces cathayae TaxID=3031124 RepID=A0ABY8K333_9ACTN|nr:RCC1 repeat domain-containing protein [Streptomyces sp. HUAS 5]WGD42511.1 RCC1 repeat domain-containing protein [Streptomyces sp. HUAS 5]